MEIEEIRTKEKRKIAIKKKDLFPLSEGYNRLLVVIACFIIAYILYEDSEIGTFFLTLFIEIIVYIAIIWIYNGFKKSLNN